MLVRNIWFVFAIFLVLVCVPWYWAYLPWPTEPSWLGIAASIWVTALSASTIVLATLLLLWHENAEKQQAIAKLSQQREAAGDQLRQVESHLAEQATLHQAELSAQREQLDTLEIELESKLEQLAVKQESWQREKKHIEAAHARLETTLNERANRLAAELKQFEQDQSDWEQRWRQQQLDLATQHEQFQKTRNRCETERVEQEKELADRQQALDDKQTTLTDLQESLEQQRWQWAHARHDEEDRLLERQKDLELKEKELQIRLEATDRRLATRAEQVARMEDRLHRDQVEWEQKLADQQLDLAQWEDTVRKHDLETKRQRERSDREVVQRLSRLDQQEAKLASNQEDFQQFQANWEEQKQRWERDIAERAEQISKLARDYQTLVLENQAQAPHVASDPDASDHPRHSCDDDEANKDGEWVTSASGDTDPNAQSDDEDSEIVHRLASLGRRRHRDRRPK